MKEDQALEGRALEDRALDAPVGKTAAAAGMGKEMVVVLAVEVAAMSVMDAEVA